MGKNAGIPMDVLSLRSLKKQCRIGRLKLPELMVYTGSEALLWMVI